jgi:AraC-like DNA-binding protein
LLLLGFALNWVGLKIAVEYNPDLARSLGGVTTEAEQQRMEAVYRQNLLQLQASLDQTAQDVKKLETLKDRFMALATPVSLKDRAPHSPDAKGGPFVMPSFPHKMMGSLFRQPLGLELQQTVAQAKSVNDTLAKQQENWHQHLEWLEALPPRVDTSDLPNLERRKKLVDRACELMLGHADEPLSILEVCSRVGTGRRKLNYCFQDVLGTTPIKYLRTVRLNSVRRALRQASPGATIQDIASHWGFWHLSQFAQDYKQLFGELPSETLHQR